MFCLHQNSSQRKKTDKMAGRSPPAPLKPACRTLDLQTETKRYNFVELLTINSKRKETKQ